MSTSVRSADAVSAAGDDPRAPRDRHAAGRHHVPAIEKFDHLPPARVDGPSAFVSIMEGCSKYCSFCVVPDAAAKRSRVLSTTC
jgi:tRNA A37 methylthiotransferase MiaB